MAEKSHPLLDK